MRKELDTDNVAEESLTEYALNSGKELDIKGAMDEDIIEVDFNP